ncbi:hypothetical protein BS78_09G103900 [Paspalum vaginatum]|nr:hypothetical protein BS78_09G103900 [Paspalum vaginatum]
MATAPTSLGFGILQYPTASPILAQPPPSGPPHRTPPGRSARAERLSPLPPPRIDAGTLESTMLGCPNAPTATRRQEARPPASLTVRAGAEEQQREFGCGNPDPGLLAYCNKSHELVTVGKSNLRKAAKCLQKGIGDLIKTQEYPPRNKRPLRLDHRSLAPLGPTCSHDHPLYLDALGSGFALYGAS